MRPEFTFLLLGRLIAHHDLPIEEGIEAVAGHQRHESGPHTALVERAVTALVAEHTAPYREHVEALAPLIREVAAVWASFAETLQAQAQGITAARAAASDRRRPAWVSPYGPPPRRR